MSKDKKGFANEEVKDPNETKEPEDHEVEGALHDLMRAQKHKKNPKMMARVAELAKGKKEEIESLSELKELRNKKFREAGAS